MAIAFLPIYIDRLGIEAYGLIGLFTVIQSLLGIFDLGLTPTVTREMARFSAGSHTARGIRDLLRSLEWICYGISALIAVGAWSVAPYLARAWVRPDQLSGDMVARAMAIMAVVFALRFSEGIYRGSLIGLGRQVPYNAINAISATVRYGGAVLILQYPSATIETFFFWQATASFLTLTALALAVHRSLPREEHAPSFSRVALRGIWRFSAGMMTITGLAMLMINSDKLLLSRLLPLDAFGHYALASVAASVIYMAVVPVTQAAYPRMVEYVCRSDDIGLLEAYRQASRLVAVVVGPAALVLSCFSAETIYSWSGSRQLAVDTAPLLSLLALAALSNCIGHLPYNLELAHGLTRLLSAANAVAVVLAIVVLPWVTVEYGSIGAAWAWLLLNVCHGAVIIHRSHASLIPTAKWQWLYRDVAIPLGGALTTVILAYLLRPTGHQSRIEWALFLLLVGAASTTVAAFLASRPTNFQIRTLTANEAEHDRQR